MSATGHIHSKNASVRITTDNGDIDLSAHGNTTDIEYNADDLEATAYGDGTHTFLQGLTVFSFAYSGWWAGSHASDVSESVSACLFDLVGESSSCRPMFWIAPAGSTGGSIGYAGCVNVQNYAMTFPTDNIATMTLNCTARAGSMSACALMAFG